MTARAMLAQLQDARLAAEDDEEAGGVGPALARREEDAEQQPVSGAAGGDGDAGPHAAQDADESAEAPRRHAGGAEDEGSDGAAEDAAGAPAQASDIGKPVPGPRDRDEDAGPAPAQAKSLLAAALPSIKAGAESPADGGEVDGAAGGVPAQRTLKGLVRKAAPQGNINAKLKAVTNIKTAATLKTEFGKGSVLDDLITACSRPSHSQAEAEFCARVLTANADLAANTGPLGRLPLHALCMARAHTMYSVEICQALLKANIDAAKTRWKESDQEYVSLPLHLLCRSHFLTEHSAEICRLLLGGLEETCLVPSGGVLPICIVVEAHPTVSDHHVTIFRRLLEANKDCIKQKDHRGTTLVHRLCVSSAKRLHSENIAECLRLVLEANKRMIDADDNLSHKPLHSLCMSTHPNEHTVAICEMLMQGNPDAIAHKDETGKLPLHHLLHNHNLTEASSVLCRKLLEAHPKSANTTDGEGASALHLLCRSPTLNRFSVDCARQLMLANKSVHEMTDKKGKVPLHALCAAMTQHRQGMEFAEEIYDMLLWSDTSALEATDDNGRLPLHLLCEAGFFSVHAIHILEKMLKAAPSTLLSRDIDGRLPLHLLCVSKLHTQLTYDAYRRLVQGLKGDQESNPASIQMHDGSLPLHNLCGAGHHSEYSLQMFRALVQAFPSSISAYDSGGQIALHRLCGASGHTTHTDLIFNELLSALSKIGKVGAELKTLQGVLPLHIICGAGNHTHNTYRIFSELLNLYQGSALVASTKEKELPIHVLCYASNHTEFSEKMCRDLLDTHDDSVKAKDARGLVPLEVLCESKALTSYSVEISSIIAKRQEGSSTTKQWLTALKVLCSNSNITEFCVDICEIIIAKLKHSQASVKVSQEFLPLHDICGSKVHNEWTGKICNLLLSLCPEWTRTENADGLLPIHLLCDCKCHQIHSVEMCMSLLDSYPESCHVPGGAHASLPLHFLASNGLHTASSVSLCKQLLAGEGGSAASQRRSDGSLPLHLLCLSSMLTDSSIDICDLLLEAYCEAAQVTAGGDDKDLALHKLCLTTPHSSQSIKICRLLVHASPDAINACGNHHDPEILKEYELKGIDPSKEPGDEPLVILCRAEYMTRYTADLCMIVSGDGDFNIHPALAILNQKVYRPKGDETQQKMALRALISLVMVAEEEAASYIELDAEAQSGPRDVAFLRGVEREMGYESDNQLLHVMRMAQVYKKEAELAGSGILLMRLNTLSTQCLEWANAMVVNLPAKIAKRAIWTPEKASSSFMRGSTPIGIALDLGDLNIVSSPAVFDVVRRAWPGKYQFDYNPAHGTIFSNLLLEFEMVGNTRVVFWTFPDRLFELLSPSILIASPMNMYFLGIMMQVALLVAFQVTLDLSHVPRPYEFSYGPPEIYLIVHVIGGMVFEIGEYLGRGMMGYLNDPWNYIDMGMYSMLGWWAYARADDWYKTVIVEGTEFTPDGSVSSTYMGMAGICIWIRILNVFGLDPYFGPLVRIMQGMTTGVLTFLILLAIFVMGFSTALRTIFRALDRDDENVVKHGFATIIEAYEDPMYSMVSLLNMSLGQFDLGVIYQVSKTALVVVFAFLACTFVMLFNLLIALMTDTYAEIRLESEQLWKKDRALLMATYTTTDPMLDRFDFSTVMTSLPQPLNLGILSGVVVCLPFYLLMQMRVKTKTWQRKANDLRLAITKAFLFLLVCLPSAIAFMAVSLPLNWVFVGSAGTFDYLRVPFLQRQPHKRIMISRALGLLGTPFFFLYLFYSFFVKFFRHCASRAKPAPKPDQEHETGAQDVMSLVHGQMFGADDGHAEDAMQKSFVIRAKADEAGLKQLQKIDRMHNRGQDEDRHAGNRKVVEIWEEEMDEDDLVILHEIYNQAKPQDTEELEAAAEMAQREKDQAILELKQDIAKNLQKVDGRQKAMIDNLRDLQVDLKKVQQDTTRSLKDLKELVHKEITQVEAHAATNQRALLELINKQSELTEKRLHQQDEKVNLLLAAVCGPVADILQGEEIPAATEGGLLLTAITRRLEIVERKEYNEMKQIQELLTKGASSTGEQIDHVSHEIMAKVNIIEAVIPKVFGDIATRLAEAEKKNEDSFDTLRSAIIEDMRPILKDLDERVKKTEEIQLENRSHMQDNLGVIAGISPALAGIEARLNASAVSLQSETKAEMGEQLSRALEAKMMELMGEIELRLRPSPVQDAAHEPSFDHRVDSAINTLEDKIADAPKRWQREWEDMNRMSSRRQDPKSNESQAKGVNGNGIASASHGHGMRTGSGKKEESLDDRIESVLSTLEGKVASPPAQWQVEWERRQAGRNKSPASTRR